MQNGDVYRYRYRYRIVGWLSGGAKEPRTVSIARRSLDNDNPTSDPESRRFSNGEPQESYRGSSFGRARYWNPDEKIRGRKSSPTLDHHPSEDSQFFSNFATCLPPERPRDEESPDSNMNERHESTPSVFKDVIPRYVRVSLHSHGDPSIDFKEHL